ncbi:cutinase family protein, partial [Microbacterium dauci]
SITVVVTGKKSGYVTTSKTSAAKTVALLAFKSAPVPTISGSAAVGQTLTAGAGSWSPAASLSYQWKRGSASISGATGSTYKLVDADAGQSITVVVTGKKSGYVTTSKTSAAKTVARSARVVELPRAIVENRTLLTSTEVVYVARHTVSISTGVTLTIPSGAVVKFSEHAGLYVAGSLVANGSAASPVVFTSLTDDAAGGDTNGDGDDTTASDSWWEGIDVADGGDLVLSHARVSSRINGAGTISSSIIEGAITAPAVRPVSITQTTVRGGSITVTREAGSTSAVAVTVKGNTVQDGAISVISNNANASAPAVVVTGNKISGHQGQCALTVEDVKLRPSNLSGNTITGNKVNTVCYAGTLVENWTVPITGPRIVIIDSYEYYDDNYKGGLTVAAGVTMTAPAGAIMKFHHAGLYVAGSLVANGSAASPVVFTSLSDDGAGGDTNGDGDDTTASDSWWQGITVGDGGSLTGTGLLVRYAATALSTQEISTIKLNSSSIELSGDTCIDARGADSASYFHGTLSACDVGIRATRHFDARDTQWGADLGPSVDENPSVVGPVAVFPWAGASVPQPLLSAPTPTSVTDSGACRDVLFIGVMGSGQRGEAGNADLLGSMVRTIYAGFKQRYLNDGTPEDLTYKVMGLDYEANAVPLFGTSGRNPWQHMADVSNYVPGAWDGSVRLISQIQKAVDQCGKSGQKIVLAGYSQGAWAVHSAVQYLGAAQSSLMDHIAGVALLADPLRSDEIAITDTGVSPDGDGIGATLLGYVGTSYMDWIQASALGTFPTVPDVQMDDFSYPSALIDRSVQLCGRGDSVCDTGWLLEMPRVLGLGSFFADGIEIHEGYTDQQLRHLGAELRETVFQE